MSAVEPEALRVALAELVEDLHAVLADYAGAKAEAKALRASQSACPSCRGRVAVAEEELRDCRRDFAERTRERDAARTEAEALRVALRRARGSLEYISAYAPRSVFKDEVLPTLEAINPLLAEGPQHPSGVVPAAGQPAALGQTGVDALRVEFTKRGLGEALMLLDLAVAVTASGSAPAAQPSAPAQAEEPLGECFGHLGPPRNTGTPHQRGETCFSWSPLPGAQPGPSGNRNEEEGR